MIDALAASDGASVFGVLDKVSDAGHDPRRFGADLLQRLRDLVILQAVPEAAAKGLIDAPEDQLAAMTAQADRLSPGTLTRYAEILHTGLTDMRGTTSPRLVLELLCARMLLPAASLEDGALLQRLERLERRLSIAAGSEGAPRERSDDLAQSPAARGSAARPTAPGHGSSGHGSPAHGSSRTAAEPAPDSAAPGRGSSGSVARGPARPAVEAQQTPAPSGSRRSGHAATAGTAQGPVRPRQARPTPVLPVGGLREHVPARPGRRIGRTTGSICRRPRRCRVLVPRAPRRRRRASPCPQPRAPHRPHRPRPHRPRPRRRQCHQRPHPHQQHLIRNRHPRTRAPSESPTSAGCGRKCSRQSSGIDGPPRYCWNRPPSRNCRAAPCTFGCRHLASRARWRSRATPTSSRPRCARSWAWNGPFGATSGPSAAGRRQPAPAVRPNPISTRRVKPVGVGRPRCRRRPASHRAHPHGLPHAVGPPSRASRYDQPDDPDDDIPDDYEDARAGRSSGPVIDPEQAAIELLTAQLGARPLDPEA